MITADLSAGRLLLFALLLLPVFATLLPLIRHDHWLFRIFDFPRLQIAALGLPAAFAASVAAWSAHPLFWLAAAANLLCTLYQFKEIAAYTRLSRPEVLAYHGADDDNTLSLLTSNVLTPNRRADLLLAAIRRRQPDVVLTLESDCWWQQQLDAPAAEMGYRYTVAVPLDNLYGMHLYSRLPLRNVEVRHWVAEDIPSIAAELQLRSGHWVRIYCLHPMPPSPTEADTATDRDAELLLVGKEIERNNHSVLVFGDLNDVAWSHTSRLFQQISGLLDPRKGRGLYNTFHAHWPLLRWPLDHIFHSNDFMVSAIKVLPDIGSDHFPVYGKFQYSPAAEILQEETRPDADERQQADEKIAAAEPLREVVREKYTQ